MLSEKSPDRRVALAAALVAVFALVGAAFSAPTAVSTAEAAPSPRDCKPYVFLGARGSGQDAPRTTPLDPDVGLYGQAGLGEPLVTEFRTIRDILGDSAGLIEPRYVAYDAVSVFPNRFEAFGIGLSRGRSAGLVAGTRAREYGRSVDQGKARLRAEVANLARYCPPSTRIILGGYSQGAHVVGDVLSGLPARLRSRVIAATLFGDPRFNPLASAYGDFDPRRHGLLGARSLYPVDSRSRVRSWCRNGDVVCQGPALKPPTGSGIYEASRELSFAPHAEYPQSEALLAAVFAIRQIREHEQAKGATPPPPPRPAARPIDVAFAVDTTGSMDPVIDSVRENLGLIRDRLAAGATDLRTALAEYRDEPAEDSSFQSRLVSGLTADAATFADAVASLYADGGGDLAESVYAGLSTALELDWRPDAAKFVVLVGDAPPKDPEPVTGLTEDAIVTRALRVPAPIYALTVADPFDGTDPDAESAFDSLAARTSGQSYVESPELAADAILAAIDYQSSAPVAGAGTGSGAVIGARAAQAAGATAAVGEPVRLSSATSSSPLGERLSYHWDFGDGAALTTPDSVVEHTWSSPFEGDVRLTVTDESGRTAQTLRSIRIAGQATPAPGSQPRPRVNVRKGRLVLSWKPPRSGSPIFYEVRSRKRLWAVVGAATDRRRRGVKLARKRLGRQALRFTVTAYDAADRSATSRPSRKVAAPRRAKRRGRG